MKKFIKNNIATIVAFIVLFIIFNVFCIRYVYNDKIIVEENSYFPIGQYSYTHCKIITIYKGINDPEKIKEEKGKIVLKEFE